MPDYKSDLTVATKQLYLAFMPYQSHTPAETWQTLSTYDALIEKPLTELTVADLTPLVCQLSKHDDKSAMVRRYLPRMMELSIDQYHRWAMGLERVFQTFKIADWHLWSETEKDAVIAFFDALWVYHLSDVMPVGTLSSADTILESIGRVVPVDTYLHSWSQMNNKSATIHIASLIVYGKKHLEDVRRWLMQPRILNRIEAAFWDCQTDTHAAMFAKAAEYLRLEVIEPKTA
ncbi:MAG: hypothetical protein AAFN11_04700 [Chloroflexota bacterium]